MKTPFDGVVRIGRREIDAMRISISVEVAQITQIETACAANQRETRRERDVLSDDALLSAHAYLARKRADLVRHREEAAAAEDRLSLLRAKAVEAYGTLKGLDSAAQSWRTDAERAIENAEQGHLDDLVTANFLRARRLALKGRA